MKLIILPLLTASILGCSSEEPKSLTGSNNSQIVNTNKQPSTGVSFVEIKPASGLKSNKTVKNQKTVEINGSTFEVSGLGGSDTFIEQENNGYVIGGSYVPMPIEEVEGEVASDLALHAFVQKDGVIKDLGTLGGNYSSASGVNSLGVIVGGSHLEDASSRAFKYENNSMSALANLSGGNHSWAYGINNSGHIVGEA
jgi:probable HAF family extracellular repeat protein